MALAVPAAAAVKPPRARATPARAAASRVAARAGPGKGGDAGAHASRRLLPSLLRSSSGSRGAARSCLVAAAAAGNAGELAPASDQPAAPRSLWVPAANAVAHVVDAVAKVVDAVAKMLPMIVFAVFGVYFMKSNLMAGLGAALRSADLLVVTALGGVGWAFGKYLEAVIKRFDEADKRSDKRFDAIDAALLKLMPPQR